MNIEAWPPRREAEWEERIYLVALSIMRIQTLPLHGRSLLVNGTGHGFLICVSSASNESLIPRAGYSINSYWSDFDYRFLFFGKKVWNLTLSFFWGPDRPAGDLSDLAGNWSSWRATPSFSSKERHFSSYCVVLIKSWIMSMACLISN